MKIVDIVYVVMVLFDDMMMMMMCHQKKDGERKLLKFEEQPDRRPNGRGGVDSPKITYFGGNRENGADQN